jgi:hypothetical protein
VSNVNTSVAEATTNSRTHDSQPAPRHRVIWGDCVAVMRDLPTGSVDAIITDPPYGVLPVGWDKQLGTGRGIQTWHESWAAEAFRVLAEGGHLVAFSASRTMHNLASALEAVGFEIRDVTDWEYGQGQGKTATTLKPAHEPIVIARKPETAATKRTRKRDESSQGGGLHLHRVPVIASASVTDPTLDLATVPLKGLDGATRMVSNKVITHEPGCEMVRRQVHLNAGEKVCDEAEAVQTGEMELWRCVDGCAYRAKNEGDPAFVRAAARKPVAQGRARYFLSLQGDAQNAQPPMYCAKPKADETEAGCEHLPLQLVERGSGMFGKREVWRHNPHQTKKPISVMDILCRLYIPAGGTVLDPFGGSGSTACAVARANKLDRKLDWRSISIELDTEGKFFPVIAHDRICHWGGAEDVSLEFHASRCSVTRGRPQPQPKMASPRKVKAASGTATSKSEPATASGAARKARAKGATGSSRRPKTAASRSRSRTGARASAGRATARRTNPTPVKRREAVSAAKRTAGTPTEASASSGHHRAARPAAGKPPGRRALQGEWDEYCRAVVEAVTAVPVPDVLSSPPVFGLIVLGPETTQVLKL